MTLLKYFFAAGYDVPRNVLSDRHAGGQARTGDAVGAGPFRGGSPA